MAKAYQPILRGFALPVAIYYAIVVGLHFIDEPFGNFLVLGTMAAATSAAGFVIYAALRRTRAAFARLEFYAAALFSLVFANTLLFHLIHQDSTRLVYFVLAVLAVAVSGVSLRVILPMSALCLATPIVLAARIGPEAVTQFLHVALASSFIAVITAVLMRTAIRREIRARLKAEQSHKAAQHAADFDFLTGLPNRRNFFSHLDRAFASPAEQGDLVLALVDINGFKRVNDIYGHALGDQLLVGVGQRIRAACTECSVVARLGGDEFAFLLERPISDAALKRLGGDICAAVGRNYPIAGNEISVSARIGFARRRQSTTVPTQLYEYADFALYRARESFATAVQFFTAANAAELDAIKQVEQQLSSSSFEDEMHVEYQPLVQVPENRVIGFEGLARWQSPQLGRVPPDIFIRAAERCGVISRLTPILLRKALADAKSWPADLRLSFNLSARDVVSPDSIDQICRIVDESGFPGDRIDFEITETSIMTDFERVRVSLSRIRHLGAHIALDDFGVGYSNFQHLDELQIDKLKIDRRFVASMGLRENSARIVKTMIEMCGTLGLTCVAEGIETENDLDAVMKAGATIVQGFHFSRPMTNDNVLPFLRRPSENEGAGVRRSA